ncbi:MAG: hypothetical protein CVU22_04805 [Betaproteobacteria bacterium HGW-Betaproteobacteria-16]|nr:MAG: hypothetical protein CVU22_04805 [Betaproteobacteria bacterium HGW-Betaproteobacteria-16]
MNTTLYPSFSRSMLSLATVLVVGLAPASHVLAQPATAFAITINGEVQPPERGQFLLQQQIAKGVANTPQLQSALRETLINQTVMAQEATKVGLDQRPEVRARLDLARQNVLAQAWQQQVLQDAPPTDASLQAEYQRQLQALGTEEVRVRHVLVSEEHQAKAAHAQIQGGVPFEQVVAQYSSDAATRESGGLTEWVPVGMLSPAVAKVLQGVEKGQLAAAPVETAAGWQVLRLEERRPYAAPAMDKVRPQLLQALAKQKLQAELMALREGAKVE